MIDLVAHRGEETTVVGAKDVLQELMIVAEMELNDVALEVLRASYAIAETICFKE